MSDSQYCGSLFFMLIIAALEARWTHVLVMSYPAPTYNILCILFRDFEFLSVKYSNELQNSPCFIPFLPPP